MRTCLILLAGVFSFAASACINAEGFSIFGRKTFYDLPISFIKKIDIVKYRAGAIKRAKELAIEYKNKPLTTRYYNELAVARIFEGKLKEAKRLAMAGLGMDSLHYGLNSNLGVIMELEGNIDSAMLMMKKAISIDKNSHWGTEWLHIKILEATKKNLEDKNWIYTNNVLLFPKPSKDSLPPSGLRAGVHQILDLEFQLKERMVFVKPVNAIVANLLLSLADMYATSADFRYADEVYLLAKEYDPKLSEIVNKRLAYIKLHGDEIIAKFKKEGTIKQQEPQLNEQNQLQQQKKISVSNDTVLAADQKSVDTNAVPKKKHKRKISNFIFFGGLALILIIAGSLYRRRRR
jgi:hypothetical protein